MANKTSSKSSPKRLYLSSKDKKIAGVCGGLGEYFSIDSTIIRLVWVITTILSGFAPGVIAYILAAIVIPPQPKSNS